jgi:hypothetical protein
LKTIIIEIELLRAQVAALSMMVDEQQNTINNLRQSLPTINNNNNNNNLFDENDEWSIRAIDAVEFEEIEEIHEPISEPIVEQQSKVVENESISMIADSVVSP